MNDHLCPRTDNDTLMCIDGVVIGPCEYEGCGGVCEAWWDCECECHVEE